MTIPKEELELLNKKYAFFGISKGRYWEHEQAMRILIWLLHSAGYELNYDKSQVAIAVPRDKSIPLFLKDYGRKKRADIVFRMTPSILVSIQVDTFKVERIIEYKKFWKKIEKRLYGKK